MSYDFSKTLIRSSCIGQIMAPPKNKKDKDAGLLGATAKGYLVKVYAEEKYGRRQDLQAKAIKKGLAVEEDAITLISKLDKTLYKKNDVRLNNKWFTGEPDVFTGISIKKASRIIDTKASWDLDSFLSKMRSTFLDNMYWWQGQGYMDLSGASEFEVSYCLVDTPQVLIDDEKKRLFWKMGVATEQNTDYLLACAEIEKNMTFNDIPEAERRIAFQINKDKEAIERARAQVIKCREWLVNFEKKHLAGGFFNAGEEEEDGE